MAMEPSFLVARNVKKKFATKRNSNKYEIVHNSLIFELFCCLEVFCSCFHLRLK